MQPINRDILRLALPSIAANITTPLLGLVDTAITGHMGSVLYLAAISVGSVMFNMLYWLFGFLRAGTSGLSAQACGRGDMRDSMLVLMRSLSVAVTVGVLMIACRAPLADLLTAIVSPDAATEPLSREYFSILIWGAPAMLATYSFTGWFLGQQNSRINLWVSLVINLTNIASSLLLVYGAGLKVNGVASGTLIAQWTGLVASLFFLRKFSLAHVSLAEVLRWQEFKRFFSVNGAIMLRGMLMITVTVWFTRAGASQGAVILSVNTMLMQMFLLFSYFSDGFAYAGEALVGKFTGLSDRGEEKRCVSALFAWGWILSIAFTCLYFFGGEEFLSLLSSDKEVRLASNDYWLWAVSVPIAGFAGFVWDGIYIGATMVKGMLGATAAGAVVFVTVYALTFRTLGNHGLWLAFICWLLTRSIVQWIIYRLRKPGDSTPKK